jgi:hypothetical protein
MSFVMPVCLSIYVSICMEQLGCYWMDFDEILLFDLFEKCVEKIQVSLKSDQNNGYFTWRRFYICDNVLLDSA